MNLPIRIEVCDLTEAIRFDRYLSQIESVRNRSRANFLIKNGFAKLNGQGAKPSSAVRNGDEVEILFPEETPSNLKPFDLILDIRFEDDDVIVLNKPSGLVVHPAAGHAEDTLVNALLKHTSQLSMRFGENRPGVVHRLDKDTSGLLVIAKNDLAHEFLAKQFQEKTVKRTYEAFVHGELKNDSGTVRSYLSRHPTQRKKFASVRDPRGKIQSSLLPVPTQGKWAVTHYKVISKSEKGFWNQFSQRSPWTRMELNLETGRTHQIRVHLSELGHPILGDPIYGSPARDQKIQNVSRLLLHAKVLGFQHPTKKSWIEFSEPWPEF